MCEVHEEVIGDCEIERMRREEAYSSRGRKDGRRGEGCPRVKGLSTGHPLTWGQAQKTPQEACFLQGGGGREAVGTLLYLDGHKRRPSSRGDRLLK